MLSALETSKTKARQFVSRGGEYFARLKSLSKHTKNEDYVFTSLNGIAWSRALGVNICTTAEALN